MTIGARIGAIGIFVFSGRVGIRPSAPKARSWTSTGLCGVRRKGTWPSWSRSVSDERLKTRSAMAVAPNWTTSLRVTNVG